MGDNTDFKVETSKLSKKIKENGYDKAILEAADKIHAKNQVVSLDYIVKGFYKETLYALSLAVTEVMGDFFLSTKKGSSGDIAPRLISINLPNGEEVKVPLGKIPLIEYGSDCFIEAFYDEEENELNITSKIRQSGEGIIKQIVDATKRLVQEQSIYKGRALTLDFNESGEIYDPEFLDLSSVNPDKILYSKKILDGLVPILARIKHKDACIEQNLDLKLGVLMEGPYGTGKTLTAFNIANIAVKHNWTFFYVKNCKYIAQTLKIAENYARNGDGVVIFTEDIDQILKGERGQTIQDVVNTLDGGENKNLPIISIFTTNHIEVIEPTFLRGKRIGSLISFEMLDQDTATQFIEKLVVDKNDKSLMVDGDISLAVEALCGIAPAFASEIIDKAKAFMIERGDGKITQEDIVISANSYKAQMEYAICKKIEENTIESSLRTIFKELSNESLSFAFVNRLAERVGFKMDEK